MAIYDQMFAAISVFAGLYALYAAIKGTGSVYKNEYPPSIKEDAAKLLRIFLWIFGPLLLIQGAMDYIGQKLISGILIGVILGLIVLYLIIFSKRFGDVVYKKRKKK